MKTTIVMSCCALLLALSAGGQTPPTTPVPVIAPTIAPVVVPTVAPVVVPTVAPIIPPTPAVVITPTPAPGSNSFSLTVSPSGNVDEDIDNAIEKKIRKHFDFTSDSHHHDDNDYGWMAVPIVFIVFITLFGTPILFLAVILYFSLSRNRAMHKTVRLMVEKGQPVPEALINPPPIVRQRSDLRRAIKWMLWGVGIMIFLGACNDWEGGAWSLGVIPLLIGVAYIIFWRLDLRKDETLPKV